MEKFEKHEINKYNNYSEILKKLKLKNTVQRCSVLEIVSNTAVPISIDEIFNSLKVKGVSINLSTVFRILETFVDKKIVTKTTVGEEMKHFYIWSGLAHKHYFYCINCKEMIPLETCPLRIMEERLKESMGFEITSHKFEISGYCKDCTRI